MVAPLFFVEFFRMGSGCEGDFMEVCQCALAGLIRN